MSKPMNVRASLLLVALAAAASVAAEPTTAPSKVDATDAAGLAAAKGREVLIEGVCSRASWSNTGKVFFINFKGVERGGFSVVAFEKLKPRLDAAFMGDAAKDFTGAKLRIRGTVSEYKGALQLVISDPSQVTVVEPASAASQPS